MTAQIGDIFKYQKKEYTVVALSNGQLFDPKNYGLEAHARCTACYRGYWCEYGVDDESLMLRDFYMFNLDGNYPPLNGIQIAPQEFEECQCYVGENKWEKSTMPAHLGHQVYRNVNLLLPYTGKILLGRDFMGEYYIHMGFQRGWAYRRLIELEFDEGLLLESHDVSHIARAKREEIKQQRDDPRYPDKKIIDESFSLDDTDKIWWLEE